MSVACQRQFLVEPLQGRVRLCAMKEQMSVGEPPITIKVRQNARAKRYSLRISNKDGGVALTVPRGGNFADAEAFARDHYGWLRKHLGRRETPKELGFGSEIMLDGQIMQIAAGQGRSVRVKEGRFLVPGKETQVPAKLRGFYKALARERLVPAASRYAAALGRDVGSISLRDTRSRWGSCTSEGNLMFSWRLMMAPREVQDYVAAHEACHLIEMNHSHRYWALVEQVFPDYKQYRHWLKKNGQVLHSYQL